jgi:hypothetical protein
VLPFDPSAEWGPKDRHDVAGTIGGRKVRGKVTRSGDEFVLDVGPAWCRDAGLIAGKDVTVSLDPEGPQVDRLGSDFAAALDAEPEARRFFESLPTFYRKNFVRWVDEAKRPETRAKRIAETVGLLKAGQRER